MEDVSLQEVLKNSFRHYTTNFYTCLPCVVLKVHNSLQECKVDVQPSINNLYKNDKVEQHPPILSVPVIFPSSKTSSFTFPINVGDTVMCVFTQRSMDNFKLGSGEPTTPNDFRRFDKRDAVAIPGLFPFGSSINNPAKHTWPHSTSDSVIAHNLGGGNEVEIRLKASGDCIINTNQKVEINCTDAVVNSDTSTVNSTMVEINASTGTFNIANTTWTGNMIFNGNLTQAGIYTLDDIVMNSHVHGGVTPGPGYTSVPE